MCDRIDYKFTKNRGIENLQFFGCIQRISINKKTGKFLYISSFVFLQRMYSLGARKFLVNNIPPAGCFPSQVINMRPIGKCDEKINTRITFYSKRLPGFTFIHSDLYGFLKKMRQIGRYYGKKKPNSFRKKSIFF